MKAYTPRDIEARKYERLQWDGQWKSAFGQPETGSCWLVLGASASGKSSFVMQLAKKLCDYGTVLYASYEEGVSLPFQDRLKYLHMNEVQGRFRVVTDITPEQLRLRLSKPKAERFIVIDSFQMARWEYEQAEELVRAFPRKGFVFVSQEYKGQPLGKPALRLRYLADVKVRVSGYKAYCQGRFNGDPGSYYTVWEEGILRTSNNL